MSKLTEKERHALNTACARLRETNLGTKLGNVEDFLDINVLRTDANTVSAAINELFEKWSNPLLNVQIPPPGFFTLAGDVDGNLWCFCNDESNPPRFEHDENTGDLYLCIADENGENTHKVHVGNYIAVKHLNNYYTRTEIDEKETILTEELNRKSNLDHDHDSRYYTENELDTKLGLIKETIDNIVGFEAVEVSNLPERGENGVIYLTPKTDGTTNDVHNEYVWIESLEKFELIGNTEVDLSNYYSKETVDGFLALKSNLGHDHNDSYYTESEVDTKLRGKADTSHNHNVNDIYREVRVGSSQSTISTPLTYILDSKASKSVASTSADGLMSKEDKAKLDSLSSVMVTCHLSNGETITYNNGD